MAASSDPLKLFKKKLMSQEGVSKKKHDQLKQAHASFKESQLSYLRQMTILRLLRDQCRDNISLFDLLGQQETKLQFKDVMGIDEIHWNRLGPSDWTEQKRLLVIDKIGESANQECLQLAQWLNYQGATKSLSEVQLQKLMSSVREKREDIRQKETSLAEIKQQIHLKKIEHYKVLSESCNLLTDLIIKYQVQYLTPEMESTVNHLTSKAQALDLKLKIINLELMVATYTHDNNIALKEIRSYMDSAQQQLELQLISVQQSLEQYRSLGPNFLSLADEYHQIMNEIENKKWSLQELGGHNSN